MDGCEIDFSFMVFGEGLQSNDDQESVRQGGNYDQKNWHGHVIEF
jgi:hypothetical protein